VWRRVAGKEACSSMRGVFSIPAVWES